MRWAGSFHRLIERIWRVAGSVSISIKILGIVLGLVALLGVGLTLQVRVLLGKTLEAGLEAQSISIAHDVAAHSTDLILINDVYGLHRLLQDTLTHNPDVRYVFVLDDNGQVVAHTFGVGFPPDLLAANGCSDCGDHQLQILATDEGRVWDSAVPIFEGRAGTVRVGLSEAGMQRTISAVTAQLLMTTVLVSVIGIAAAVMLTWVLTRPILALVAATQAVTRGDLTQHVERWANDEIGTLADSFNAMTRGLALAEQARSEHDQLRAQLLERVISAQEDERKRISRELHDETGQAITSLMVGLRTLANRCPAPAVQSQAEELREVAAAALDGVRALALELRPSVLDDLGLEAALNRYVSDYQSRHHLPVDIAVRGLADHRLPAPVETALYRIIQESLTNVARHANAQTVSLLLEHRGSLIRAIIEDDGCGFNREQLRASSDRLGLYGMQERVELLGGSFEIESGGSGTTIMVDIPLEGQETHGSD